MRIKQVPISELTPAEYNPRIHPDSAIDQIVKSVEAFGVTNPILAQKSSGVIIAGHARAKRAA